MGPYCKFCGTRCFVSVTAAWPEEIVKAYGRFSIAATCRAGQQLEKDALGYCYDDAKDSIISDEVTAAAYDAYAAGRESL